MMMMMKNGKENSISLRPKRFAVANKTNVYKSIECDLTVQTSSLMIRARKENSRTTKRQKDKRNEKREREFKKRITYE